MIYMINYVKVNGKIYTSVYFIVIIKEWSFLNSKSKHTIYLRISFSNVIETKTKAIYGPLSLLSPLLRQQKSKKTQIL